MVGTKLLWRWSVQDVKQELDQIKVRLDTIGAQVVSSRWSASCEFFKTNPTTTGAKAELVKFRCSDSDSCFLVTADQVVEAGLRVQSLLDVDEGNGDAGTKLTNPRFVKKHPFSFEGHASYQVGDFLIRLAMVRMGSKLQDSVFLEMEYKPCSKVSADAIMYELFQNIVSSEAGLNAAFSNMAIAPGDRSKAQREGATDALVFQQYPSLPPYYTYQHLAIQYVQLVKSLAKD